MHLPVLAATLRPPLPAPNSSETHVCETEGGLVIPTAVTQTTAASALVARHP
jgi:hypothetical protein